MIREKVNHTVVSTLIAGKSVALCLNSTAVRLYTAEIVDMELDTGFTSFEFSHLVYAAYVAMAENLQIIPTLTFIDVYDTVKSLRKTEMGIKEIERVAKSLTKSEGFQELKAAYPNRQRNV